MKPLSISIAAIGPATGSADESATALQYLHLPTHLDVYPPPVPALHEKGGGLSLRARDLMQRALDQLAAQTADMPATALDLARLPREDRVAVDLLLQDGDVNVLYAGARRVEIQLSAYPGLWRVRYFELGGSELVADMLEIGSVPRVVSVGSFPHPEPHWQLDPASLPGGVVNAPLLLMELLDRSELYAPGESPYALDLSQLPQGPEDLQFLAQSLGQGPVTVLTRGRGHCRINSTRLPYVWWLQHYAASDSMILNTLEVIDVPAAVCVSQHELAIGAMRFAEALQSLK